MPPSPQALKEKAATAAPVPQQPAPTAAAEPPAPPVEEPTNGQPTQPEAQAEAKPGKKKSKKAAHAAPKEESPPEPAAEPEPDRPVVYPHVSCEICIGDNAINVETAKIIMHWETEKEYGARVQAANPGAKDDDPFVDDGGAVTTFKDAKKFGEAFMLTDDDKDKIRCWNNLDNRPFDDNWSRGLAQTILKGQWAGPLTIPELTEFTLDPAGTPILLDGQTFEPGSKIKLPAGTINGSAIVVSRTGRVESGQHTLVALILAHQMWSKNKAAYPFWANSTTGPVIETILVTGISEDRRVLMTVDNCKPRSEADVFYTSPLFRTLLPSDRKECSRMLASETDFLWSRLDTKGYKTHSEVVAFVDRHPKMLKCLEHLFVENSKAGGRRISNLKLSAGQCAGMMYLMGSSGPKTDGDAYRNGNPPQEKGIHWENWDKAKDFWATIGNVDAKELAEVRAALLNLKDTDPDPEEGGRQGLGGRFQEKLAVISKAWEVWAKADKKARPEVTADDLMLHYGKPNDKGEISLEDYADFGGIDVPDKSTTGGPDGKEGEGSAPTDEAGGKTAAEQARMQRAVETAAKLKAMRLGKDGKPAVVKVAAGPTATTAPVAAPVAAAS